LEYGVTCRRLVPNNDLLKLPFGSMWCEIEPGGHSLKHAHADDEIFVAWSGSARVESGGRSVILKPGDSVHVVPDVEHEIFNLSESEQFVCLSIYWVRGEEAQ
jgi:quercetin dioxygenase-like cupin family protein